MFPLITTRESYAYVVSDLARQHRARQNRSVTDTVRTDSYRRIEPVQSVDSSTQTSFDLYA